MNLPEEVRTILVETNNHIHKPTFTTYISYLRNQKKFHIIRVLVQLINRINQGICFNRANQSIFFNCENSVLMIINPTHGRLGRTILLYIAWDCFSS